MMAYYSLIFPLLQMKLHKKSTEGGIASVNPVNKGIRDPHLFLVLEEDSLYSKSEL